MRLTIVQGDCTMSFDDLTTSVINSGTYTFIASVNFKNCVIPFLQDRMQRDQPLPPATPDGNVILSEGECLMKFISKDGDYLTFGLNASCTVGDLLNFFKHYLQSFRPATGPACVGSGVPMGLSIDVIRVKTIPVSYINDE